MGAESLKISLKLFLKLTFGTFLRVIATRNMRRRAMKTFPTLRNDEISERKNEYLQDINDEIGKIR